MFDVLNDLAATALVRAIEGNAAALLMEMGRAGGGEQRDDSRLRWTLGGSPIDYHNCVVHAALRPREADAAIVASRERLQALGVPGTWHVGPSMRPRDLGQRLLAHGFVAAGSEPGMAADLSALPADLPAPPELAVERVRDEPGLALWAQTLARGFGEGPREAAWVAEVYARIGYSDALPWRHFLARAAGEPAATATLFLGAGAAGLYFVMTVPEARRRGIGAAITLAALREARALGYRVGVLGASEMGRPVYARLGFREYCTIDLYAWTPPTAKAAADTSRLPAPC